ncbi:MAG: transcription termination/antitermination NusG family protein [Anaerolineaceae bacterium]|nr:transcription termination/antitermination NusG family protein [Anaerolineaceae bacterium]
MPINWYTLHSQPHKEDLLWQQVLSRGFECFYPRIRVTPINPRSRKIRPYFPGYMFVHTDLDASGSSIFRWMPYATGLVSFGGDPATVSDALVNALKRRIMEIEQAGGEFFESVHPGDPVLIEDGPFAGYEAIFDVRLPGTERVRVLLKMLSHRVLSVELQAASIKKKKK